MPHTIRKNAREWQRIWRGGDTITEIDGDDPGMLRRAPRHDRLELDTDASGEPVSWVAKDQIDRIIYHWMLVMFMVYNLTI